MKILKRAALTAVSVVLLLAGSLLLTACSDKAPLPDKVIKKFTENDYTVLDYRVGTTQFANANYDEEASTLERLTNDGIDKYNEEMALNDENFVPLTGITEAEIRAIRFIIAFKGDSEENFDFYYICFGDNSAISVFSKIISYSGEFPMSTKKNNGYMSSDGDGDRGFFLHATKDALALME